MMASFKSELRKLLSVRSTYFVSFLAVAFVVLFSWVTVWDMRNAMTSLQTSKSQFEAAAASGEEVDTQVAEDIAAMEAEIEHNQATRLREAVMNAIPTAALFVILIVILQIVHEYRYNTIMHTITASNSRTKVFVSKLMALLGFALFIGLIAGLVSVVTFKISVAAYGLDWPAQEFDTGGVLLRGAAFMIAYVSFAAIIAFFSRNIALAIAVFLIVPSTVESLLGIWLKHNTVYLPFSAMSQILLYNPQAEGSLDLKHALMTTAAYLVVLYPLTWYLFLKRDAN